MCSRLHKESATGGSRMHDKENARPSSLEEHAALTRRPLDKAEAPECDTLTTGATVTVIEPELRMTEHGLRRAPCVRTRCVARRRELMEATKLASASQLRLVLRAWHSEAHGHAMLARAAVRLIDHHARTRALQKVIRLWRSAHSSRPPAQPSSSPITSSAVAERCVAAAAMVLLEAVDGSRPSQEDAVALARSLAESAQGYQPYGGAPAEHAAPATQSRPRRHSRGGTLARIDIERVTSLVADAIHVLLLRLHGAAEWLGGSSGVMDDRRDAGTKSAPATPPGYTQRSWAVMRDA